MCDSIMADVVFVKKKITWMEARWGHEINKGMQGRTEELN